MRADTAAVLSLIDEARAAGGSEAIQYILAMATLSVEQDALIQQRFPHAMRVSHAGVLPPRLRQRFHLIPASEASAKPPYLVDLLRGAADDGWLSGGGAMVFCADAALAADIHALLEAELPHAAPSLLTEGTAAVTRTGTIAALHAGTSRLLVCTDVASRGLDIPSMRHVVMFDLPSDASKFIHRAGRTARFGRDGQVSCLVQSHELDQYRKCALPLEASNPSHQSTRHAQVLIHTTCRRFLRADSPPLGYRLHEGEALPGTALHKAGGRAGVAMPAERAKPAEQRGWLALGDLSADQASAVTASSNRTPSPRLRSLRLRPTARPTSPPSRRLAAARWPASPP